MNGEFMILLNFVHLATKNASNVISNSNSIRIHKPNKPKTTNYLSNEYGGETELLKDHGAT